MAIPKDKDIHLPLLRFAAAQSGSEEIRLADAVQYLAKEFQLTKEEGERKGGKTHVKIFYHRVSWARQYLISKDFIKKTGYGIFSLTEEGKRLDVNSPEAKDYTDLENLIKFNKSQSRKKQQQKKKQQQTSTSDSSVDGEEEIADVGSSPDERVRLAYEELKSSLQSDLKDQIFSKEMNPRKFELLVLRFLEKIGYGEGGHTGGTGDGGIDGIMNKDRLGFRRVFVQVKYYQPKMDKGAANNIAPKDIQAFVGSLGENSGDAQGIFVTSSTFTKGAREAATRATPHHIVLIDGDRLTELMVKHEIGIRVKNTYSTYDIDKNFWTFDDD